MIPPFPKFYYPVLKLLSDGKIYTKKDLDKAIIGIFSLSASDCSERTAGGGQTRLYDRVQWCVSHLRKAGLVESPKRGESKITQKGIELLNSGVTDINQQTLANYSLDFAKFSNLKS